MSSFYEHKHAHSSFHKQHIHTTYSIAIKLQLDKLSLFPFDINIIITLYAITRPIYCIGNNLVNTSVYVLDLQAGDVSLMERKWEPLLPTISKFSNEMLSYYSAVLLDQQYIVVYEGHFSKQNQDNISCTICAYNLVNNTWISNIAPLQCPRINHTFIPCKGHIYAIAGRNKRTSSTGRCEVYDPVQNSWTYVKNIPSHWPWVGECGVEYDGKVYVFGSYGECFDPKTGQWTPLVKGNKLNTCQAAAVVLPNNTIAIMGGWRLSHDQDVEDTDMVRLYFPATDTWQVKDVSWKLPEARSFFSACLPDNSTLFISNSKNFNNYDVPYMLHLPTGKWTKLPLPPVALESYTYA